MGLYRNIMEYHRNPMEIHGSFPLNDEMIHGGHRGFPYRFAKTAENRHLRPGMVKINNDPIGHLPFGIQR